MCILRNYWNFVASVIIVAALVSCSAAADWPQFRGPNADGISTSDVAGPTNWTATENVIWKVKSPGFGASSPVMKGDHIYLTGYFGYGTDEPNSDDMGKIMYRIACYNRKDGSVAWHRDIRPARSPETKYQGMSALHGYASPTPAVDDKNVYVSFGNSGVYALTLDGNPLWHTDVGSRTHGWNCGTSPIVWNNLVIINASVESSSVIALDKRTGDKVWTSSGIDDSWATPLIVRTAQGNDELVVSMKNKTQGLDPASGRTLWNCESVQDYVCPSVIAHDDIAYITGGRKPYFMAVRTGGRGDVTESQRSWNVGVTSKVSTPIYLDGYLYFVDQQGTATCLDAKTGAEQYRERLGVSGRGDKVYASPVEMGGRLYCFSRADGCVVLAAKPTFELIAKNSLGDDSIFNATPIVDNGQIIVRSDKFVYCIGEQ